MLIKSPAFDGKSLYLSQGSAVTQTQHYGFVDALRGLAFLAVFAVHTRDLVPGLPTLVEDVLGRGYAGVQLFFVVSAFTLCASLNARAHDPAPLQAYFLRRAFRIVPMFWGAIVLFTALYGLTSDTPRWGAPDGLSVQHVALAALLLHGFNLPALNGVVPGGWSVATEVQFYLLLPLLMRWASTLKRAMLLWLAMLALSIVALPGLEYVLAPLHPAEHRNLVHQFAFYALPTQLPVFGCGLILYRLLGPDRAVLARFERRLPAAPRYRAMLIIAVVMAVGLPLRLSAWPLGLVKTFPGHLGYGVLAALLTYALATCPLGLLVNPLSRFFGRISYSGYLLHFAVLYAVNPLILPWVAGRSLLHLATIGGVGLTLTTAAAAFTYAVVEQPGIAIGRRLIMHLAARFCAAAATPLAAASPAKSGA